MIASSASQAGHWHITKPCIITLPSEALIYCARMCRLVAVINAVEPLRWLYLLERMLRSAPDAAQHGYVCL